MYTTFQIINLYIQISLFVLFLLPTFFLVAFIDNGSISSLPIIQKLYLIAFISHPIVLIIFFYLSKTLNKPGLVYFPLINVVIFVSIFVTGMSLAKINEKKAKENTEAININTNTKPVNPENSFFCEDGSFFEVVDNKYLQYHSPKVIKEAKVMHLTTLSEIKNNEITVRNKPEKYFGETEEQIRKKFSTCLNHQNQSLSNQYKIK